MIRDVNALMIYLVKKGRMMTDILKKNIAIYGTGVEAEKFYVEYADIYNVLCFVDSVKREKFHGVNVYSLDEYLENRYNIQLIVATSEYFYGQIKKELRNYELVEYVDFVWKGSLGKKIVVLYGNCHFMPVCEYLCNNAEFSKHYYIDYHRVGSEEFDSVCLENSIKNCAVLVMQDIRKDNDLGILSCEELCDKYNSKCNIITLPNLYGCNLFYPQVRGEIYEDRIVVEKHAKDIYEISENNLNIIRATTSWRDQNIDSMYRDRKSVSEIVDYLDNDIYSEKDIIENFIQEMNKLKMREEKCTIHISDCIEEKYMSELLFYEPNHPTNVLLHEMAKRILKELKILHIENGVDNYKIFLDSREIFIYKCVRRALGLEFKQITIRNNDKCGTFRYRSLSLEDYILQYIKWMF